MYRRVGRNPLDPEAEAFCVNILALLAMIGSTPHLLFVDDETELRTLMAERLRERGFEVSEAEDGERALDLLEAMTSHAPSSSPFLVSRFG